MRCAAMVAALPFFHRSRARGTRSTDMSTSKNQHNQQSLPHLSADRLAVRTEESEADDMMTMKSSSQMDCPLYE